MVILIISLNSSFSRVESLQQNTVLITLKKKQELDAQG